MNKSLAILGAGKLGTVLAQLALKAGYKVYLAGSGPASKIAMQVKILTPGAIASSSEDAIKNSDVVILALPLSNYKSLPADTLKGKLVIDAMNYWWETDGHSSELSNPETSSSELVQAHLSQSRVVKALSHMGYHHLLDEARPSGEPDRKAIAIAGDNEDDTAAVAEIIDDLGFDPVIIGGLSSGKFLQPGHPAFGANVDVASLQEYIAESSLTLK